MLGAGAKRSKPLEAAIGNGQKSTEPADDILSRNPFLRDEELTDIEGFLKNFPRLHEYYIPVQIIGEGRERLVTKTNGN
jgi:beta-galactosidase beta subunit